MHPVCERRHSRRHIACTIRDCSTDQPVVTTYLTSNFFFCCDYILVAGDEKSRVSTHIIAG